LQGPLATIWVKRKRRVLLPGDSFLESKKNYFQQILVSSK